MAHMSPISTVVLTENKQQLVLVCDDKELFTLRVQAADGHNRAVAKLNLQQSREVWNVLGAWLAR